MENKVNIFGKSFNFDVGSVVRWNDFSERKDFYGILIEIALEPTGPLRIRRALTTDMEFRTLTGSGNVQH